ncbi:MAG: hypothetical protein AB1801_07070 [Chloroflexota bacterium]
MRGKNFDMMSDTTFVVAGVHPVWSGDFIGNGLLAEQQSIPPPMT